MVMKPKPRGGRVAAPALVERLVPAHGVGEVQDIEEKDFGGRKTPCYVIKIRDSGLKVMVPTEAASRASVMTLHAYSCPRERISSRI